MKKKKMIMVKWEEKIVQYMEIYKCNMSHLHNEEQWSLIEAEKAM
jgi:hypothetical protein